MLKDRSGHPGDCDFCNFDLNHDDDDDDDDDFGDVDENHGDVYNDCAYIL